MPKRVCPFDYDLIPQQKIHVSDKEIKHEDQKKNIYDKTLKMLFKGARNLPNAVSPPSLMINEVQKIPRDNYKQLLLDNCCNLRPSGTVKPLHKAHCKSCSGLKCEMDARCGFCDTSLCWDCFVVCRNCQDEFCKSCSLPMYSGIEDEYVCINCCT